MALPEMLETLLASVNNLMGVIDGKLRNKANKADVYTRTEIDDPLRTLGANAATAAKLKVARLLTLGGEATGEVGFDGSGNVTLMVTVPGLLDKANKVDTLTPAQIDARIQTLIGSAPAALDTLKELADALGNDPNFATSMTTALAAKADKATGRLDIELASIDTGEKLLIGSGEVFGDSTLFTATALVVKYSV